MLRLWPTGCPAAPPAACVPSLEQPASSLALHKSRQQHTRQGVHEGLGGIVPPMNTTHRHGRLERQLADLDLTLIFTAQPACFACRIGSWAVLVTSVEASGNVRQTLNNYTCAPFSQTESNLVLDSC